MEGSKLNYDYINIEEKNLETKNHKKKKMKQSCTCLKEWLK